MFFYKTDHCGGGGVERGEEPDYRTNKNKKGYRVIKTTEGNESERIHKNRREKGLKDRHK